MRIQENYPLINTLTVMLQRTLPLAYAIVKREYFKQGGGTLCKLRGVEIQKFLTSDRSKKMHKPQIFINFMIKVGKKLVAQFHE